MKRIETDDTSAPGGRPVVTVGTYDGVHLGHRKVLDSAVGRARELGESSVVVTFDRHPLATLDPGKAPDLVTSVEHRLILLERAGVDAAVVLRFDGDLAGMPAKRFVQEVVAGSMGAGVLVLGEGALLGSDCAGGERLETIAREAGIELVWVEPVVLEGVKVSSTEVRRCIQANDLRSAERLLGRPVTVLGSVVEGVKRGRDLGFRTANLDLHHEMRPPTGVYATWASLGGGWTESVSNVGPSPDQVKVYGEGSDAGRVVEVHLLGFEGEIYGRSMEVAFCGRIRDELRFDSDAELSERIAGDVEAAREMLAGSAPPAEEILA